MTTTISYPLNLPQPTSVSFGLPANLSETVKMASGRRRVRSVIPGMLYEGTVKWTFDPDEYRLFMGWWVHVLRNGSHLIEFDDDSAMVLNVGLKRIMLKTNTLSAPAELASKVEVSCGFYGLQEA